MRLLALIAALIATPTTALAMDGEGSGAGPFIFGLLGAVPVLVPTLLLFIKLGHDRGKAEAEFAALVGRVDKLTARVEESAKEFHSEVMNHTASLSSRLEATRAHLDSNFVGREHLVLRLTALEAKIEADVAKSMSNNKGGPP